MCMFNQSLAAGPPILILHACPWPVCVCRLSEKGVRLTRPSLFTTLASRQGLFQELSTELLSLVQQGVVKPHIHKIYPLAAAAEAHKDLESRSTVGKLLLQP